MMGKLVLEEERRLLIKSEVTKEHPRLLEYLIDDERCNADCIESEPENIKMILYREFFSELFKQAKSEWKSVYFKGGTNLFFEISKVLKPCQLCGARLKYLFYIENRINQIRLRVGCECIEKYNIELHLDGAKERAEFIKQQQRMSISGRRKAYLRHIALGEYTCYEEQLARIQSFDIVLPKELMEEVVEAQKNVERWIKEFCNDKKNDEDINEWKSAVLMFLSKVNKAENYVFAKRDDIFILTKAMRNWIEQRHGREWYTIHKQEIKEIYLSGRLNESNYHLVTVEGYVNKLLPILKRGFELSGINVIQYNPNSNEIVLPILLSKREFKIRFLLSDLLSSSSEWMFYQRNPPTLERIHKGFQGFLSSDDIFYFMHLISPKFRANGITFDIFAEEGSNVLILKRIMEGQWIEIKLDFALRLLFGWMVQNRIEAIENWIQNQYKDNWRPLSELQDRINEITKAIKGPNTSQFA